MASIRDLKRDINNVLGDIIDRAQLKALEAEKDLTAASEKIIDEAIVTFDDLVAKISDRSIENRSEHLKSVSRDLEEKAKALVDKINKL
ncbi:MAG: hypothetical protein RQ756_03550 [Flavobacteriaceae bacterium]|nr:hypothetical protein [Flavobacteriaceae bacterium]